MRASIADLGKSEEAAEGAPAERHRRGETSRGLQAKASRGKGGPGVHVLSSGGVNKNDGRGA